MMSNFIKDLMQNLEFLTRHFDSFGRFCADCDVFFLIFLLLKPFSRYFKTDVRHHIVFLGDLWPITRDLFEISSSWTKFSVF